MDQEIDKIVDADVVDEMSESFLAYSMSVIMSRALPDVRDGLKPVHRRILYAMLEEGMKPDSPTRKCAVAVGSTMGRYHPHGDASIYDSLVRMAQDFRMRLPLIYPFGNFGSLDDGPAAPRYTECRLDPPGMLLLEDIRENTVDFAYNYSGELMEPQVLPAAFPNLLVNGGSGIAVGMASNMPSHNLIEVVEGIQAMIKNPAITLDELMTHIPGPDFPSGATIIGGDAIREAYATGRGTIKMRGVAKIEDISARRRGIVFTALPYNVGGEKVMAEVKTRVKAGKLLGVADIKDLSNLKNGTKIVVECKTGFNPQAVLEDLYKMTSFEDSFGINNVCIVNMRPETLGLVELCRNYVMHRVNVITRRTQFRLDKALARAHILEGLITALASIDEVVAIIRKSKDTPVAREGLIKKFILSVLQADAILEMRLARLTSLEVSKLEDELKELQKVINELQAILASKEKINTIISDELSIVSAKYGNARRSKILSKTPEVKAGSSSLEIPDEPTLVSLSTTGLIARFEVGPNKAKLSKDDLVLSQVETTSRSTIGAITTRGRLLRQSVVEFPKAEGRSRGGDSKEFFNLENESIVSLISLDAGSVITMVTKQGFVKRLLTDALPNSNKPGAPVIGLKDGDTLVSADLTKVDAPAYDIVIISSTAQLLRTSAEGITPKGAPAGGMAGIKLAEGAVVLAAGLLPEGAEVNVATLSDGDGFKVTDANEYPAKGRGGAGVRCMTFKKGETALVAAWVGSGELYGVNASGEAVLMPLEKLKRDASGIKLEDRIEKLAVKR